MTTAEKYLAAIAEMVAKATGTAIKPPTGDSTSGPFVVTASGVIAGNPVVGSLSFEVSGWRWWRPVGLFFLFEQPASAGVVKIQVGRGKFNSANVNLQASTQLVGRITTPSVAGTETLQASFGLGLPSVLAVDTVGDNRYSAALPDCRVVGDGFVIASNEAVDGIFTESSLIIEGERKR